jgi:hypothetical protein
MKSTIAFGILASIIVLHGTAFAVEQDKAQQKCINSLNKGMAKVAKAQLKADAKCTSGFAKGKNTDAVACYSGDAKVNKAAEKLCAAETKVCTTPPTFGKTSCGNVNNYATFNATEHTEDLFGFPVNSGITLCATDKAACKCQGKLVKAGTKLYSTYLKTYDKCKKSALKGGAADVTALNTCVSDDTKGKIAKATTKLGATVDKSCGVTMPFSNGSRCTGLSGAALGSCVSASVRCYVCITEVGSDALGVNCDVFDDASDNGSCFDDF